MNQSSHFGDAGRAACVAVHEHSDALRAVLEQTLHDEGFPQTQSIRSVRELGDALTSREPDLLLFDLDAPDAPGADAFALCREIRRQNPRLGLLAMSTRVNADRLARCLDAGADHLLGKPLAAPELAAHVRRVLSRAQAWAASSSPEPTRF